MKVDSSDSEIDSVTTPISTSQMKSEFRDQVDENMMREGSLAKNFGDFPEKDKRRTMQPRIEQLTVCEEASISMEQSSKHETETEENKINETHPVVSTEPRIVVSFEQGQ